MLGNYFFSSTGEDAYEIEQSLRFDGTTANTLKRTPSSAGNRRVWTVSVWAKHAGDGSYQSSGYILFTGTSSTNTNQVGISLRDFDNDNGRVSFYMKPGGSNQYRYSAARLRDPNAWYHHVISYNYGTFKYFLNGVEQTTTGSTFSNFDTGVNSTLQHRIGYGANSSGQVWNFWHGYFAEYHLLDGTAVTDATDFGEYDENGVWRPIEYTGGSYGTNGFYLKFDPDATNGIGHDHSGNGNNFTASGFVTSGAGTDVMSDTPTNNFATLNFLDWSYTSGATLNNGNLYFRNTSTTAYSTVRTGFRVPASGKYYFEFTLGVASNHTNNVGLIDGNGNVWVWSHASSTSKTKYNGTDQSTEGSSSNGAICAFAINNGQIRLYRGNTLLHTWSQSASGYVRAYVSNSWSNSVTFNFGQRAFNYTPPTDHVGWCTANLPAPDIADGSDYFNTVLYTGTGASNSVTGVGFQPDWVWLKKRNTSASHNVYDAVRGVQKRIKTDSTNAEDTRSNGLTSFNSDGFTVVSDAGANTLNDTYVAWNWKANGSGSSNTSGSITSTVSANASAGFSIVSYTGAGSNSTVGHGLSDAPKMVWIKKRSETGDFVVYTEALGPSKVIYVNENYDSGGSGIVFGSTPTAPTSTVFSVGNHTASGASGKTYVAYCFAEVEGYSKLGTYIGNGSLDGPFVWCGFKPSWVVIKSLEVTGEWFIVDTARNPYNPSDEDLFANYNFAETSSSGKDLLSNGFKIRESGSSMNSSGKKFLFMAFAENPFGGDGVSPATAR